LKIRARIVSRRQPLAHRSPSARSKARELDELKREIIRLAADVPARDTEALFRLPIDRVFTMKGFGAVVYRNPHRLAK